MSDLKSLGKVFENKIFRIPDYQRGYSWGEEQIREFCEDILSLQSKRNHYTGLISLKKIDKKEAKNWINEKWILDNNQYNAYYVIDGQQRLTTCVIFINEIINYVRNLPENRDKYEADILIKGTSIKDIREKFIYIEDPNSNGTTKTYKFGYEKDEQSYDYLINKILENSSDPSIEETIYTLNLKKAKLIFNRLITQTYKKHGINGIEEIFVKLTQNLMFNIHYINNDSNVYVSFETMNNRGKPLSNLELLKNRLIYLTTLFEDKGSASDSVRASINKAWKTIYKYLGMNPKKALNDDEFLRNHWIIYFRYSRSKVKNKTQSYDNYLLNEYFTQRRVLQFSDEEKILQEVEENDAEYQNGGEYDDIEENDILENVNEVEYLSEKLDISDIKKYVESMKKLVGFWYAVNFPQLSNQSKKIKEWLIKLNRLGVAHFRPLTTVVLSKEDISEDEKREYLKALERYIFINFKLAKHPSNYKDSHFYILAHELYTGEKNLANILTEIRTIEIIDKNGVIKIENDVLPKFKKYFADQEGFYTWKPALNYFLYEYELSLKRDEGSQSIDPNELFENDNDKISIEHIYPQTPTNEYWQAQFKEFNDEEKRILCNTLGNLLPLSLRINRELQNNSFIEKKEERYFKGSQSEIEVSKYENWDAFTILERGKKLLDFMEKHWEFKFKSEADKIKLLGVEFLVENIEEYETNYVYEDMDMEKSNRYTRSKITKEMIERIYELAKDVYENKIDQETAANKVSSELDMNINSAYMYIYCVISMLNGEVFKREINSAAVKYYIEKIFQDYGKEYGDKALKSYRMHIDYKEKIGFKSENNERMYEELSKLIK